MAVLEFFQPSVKLHNRHISSYTFNLCDLYITYIICICLSSNRFLLFFLRLLCVVYCFLLLGPPSILRRGLKSHQPKKSMSFPLDAESWFQIKDSHGILRGLSNPQSPKGCQLHPPLLGSHSLSHWARDRDQSFCQASIFSWLQQHIPGLSKYQDLCISMDGDFVWFFVTAVRKISLRDLTHLTFDTSIDLISIFPLWPLHANWQVPYTTQRIMGRFQDLSWRHYVFFLIGVPTLPPEDVTKHMSYVSELSHLIQQLQSNNQMSQNKMATNWWKLLRHIWLLIPDIQIHIIMWKSEDFWGATRSD